ncbi:phenylacetate--CoA ligase family protein [Bacillus sp. ISL-47]|uniref:phenylacetate--CoA ligase family protein n=1 Tax=Bacillus sp. ISL-47 TaxID=2819130 RepID=UPI001BE980A0|nr:hypothetical protein [Bacillus sp. ISL-47]MBT2689221.1 phenylacetate--CoA ligase family protein [Bacillus sp. ISL-47]MBT2708658.1 phenylacetate--CoA ligase family protein [Pseudomonas sp. ISL-84]
MSVINTVKKIYTNIPLWLTNSFAPFYYLIPETKRYGRVFETQRRYLKELELLSDSRIEELVNIQFVNLVRHAYENVPYYHNLFDEHGILVSSFKDVRDIKKIPFLTKELLIKHREELIATNIDRKSLQYITTSGSTGNPVGFYVDSDSTMKEWAYTLNLWERVGYRPDSSRLLFRGKTFWAQKNKGENWQYDAFRRELSCNIFDLCEENLEQYCQAIEKYKPEFVHGYMSAINILCKYIEKRPGGLRHQFKAILAVSENVLVAQREYIELILNSRVFSFYGHSERLVMAGECEYSNEYHIEPLYGFAEIVDRNGQTINDDSTGELVSTGFCNKGMPMLRYKTGDMASWSQKVTCNCGRPHKRIAGVHGRWKQDILVNRDGALVSLTAINMHSDVFDKILRYQFYQDTVGEVVIKILPRIGFNAVDETKILKQLNEKTQGKINYKIELVDQIPLKKNGKYTIVNQQLKV